MSDPNAERMTVLIQRLKAGDLGARIELLDLAHERLRRLAGVLLSCDFPPLLGRHDPDSVLHQAWPRMLRAMEAVSPPTPEDFFRLAASKIRQTLLDLLSRQRARDGRERSVGSIDALGMESPTLAQSSGDPARLSALTEIHHLVGELPSEERTVFEMHYYLDLPQAEIAPILGKSPRQVSYLWVAATGRLARRLGGAGVL